MTMMHGEKTLVCVAGAFVLCAVANARAIESSGNPYQEIVARNVFALTNPPPPPRPEDNKPPPPKITLTGITSILGKKRALMKVQTPAKPGAKQEEQSFILTEGQRDGEIEVLEIDEKAGTVKVNDFGTITNLSFENNGVKLASGPPPGPPGGGPPPNAGAVPGAPGNPTFTPGSTPLPRTIPGRPMRMNSTGAAAYPGGSGGTAAVGSVAGSTTPGTVALNGLGGQASTPGVHQSWPPETPMTPEEAAIMGAAYNLKHQKAIAAGDMPSLPPDPNIPTY